MSRISAAAASGSAYARAYLEPPSVAFRRKAEVDHNFVELMQVLLDSGNYPAIATHDERMIDATRGYERPPQPAPRRVQFR